MGLFGWLFGISPTSDEPPPQNPPPVRKSSAIKSATPRAERAAALPQVAEGDESLNRTFCNLEYEDVEGKFTRRPVTLVSLTRQWRMPAIVAYCHMRNDVRHFRVDRIRSVITGDGEVLDAQSFLAGTFGIILHRRRHVPQESITNGRLHGKRVAFSGDFHAGYTGIRSLAKAAGAEVAAGTVNDRVDLLVIGHGGVSDHKLNGARKRGIAVVGEFEFIKMLNE